MQTLLSPRLESTRSLARTSAVGLFGAHGAAGEDPGAILGRLSPARRQATACLTTRSAAISLSEAGWVTLLSGPWISRCTGSRSSPGAPVTVVSFVGHLTEAIPGLNVSAASPAEVVQAAYAKWGTECFGRLNGNYSCAIYDGNLPALIIARDAAGTKPIFYSVARNFIFGSSAREVHRASGLAARINPGALERYVACGTVDGADDTLLQGVCALPASHYLEVAAGRPPTIHRIASPFNAGAPVVVSSFDESSEELRRLLVDTVSAQSLDGRVGVAISGGTDSSGVIACVRKALGRAQPLPAFSFVHDHPAIAELWNERPWAERMAQHADATLHLVRLEAAAIPGAMSQTFQSQDFPYGSPVVLAQAEVSRVAADQGVEIMLSGHGPDVLFGAGNSHILVRASKLLRRGRVEAAWRVLKGASDDASASPGRLMVSAIRRAFPIPVPWGRPSLDAPWLRKSWRGEHVVPQSKDPLFESADLMHQVIIDQLYRSTLPTGVHVEESNAMAFGIENRYPYLVAAMLRLSRQFPVEHLISERGQTKHVLRSALRGLVPDPILDRRTRACFPVPALPWVHELRPWITERMRELGSLPFFSGPSPHSLWEQLRGTDARAWTTAFHAWRWISLLEWAKTHDVRFS